MADAFISPAVGGTFWAVSGAWLVHCSRKLAGSGRDHIVPMMGVMGAFVFAAQMINVAIPGTGSSGHLGGGLLLAILLGPHAAFLVMASVLAIQALFFADGGLLALGCTIFNLGFIPACVAYPLFYNLLQRQRAGVSTVATAVFGLLLGALMVSVQTMLSGISELPARIFTTTMLAIHLPIGVLEGLATTAVVTFVRTTRPGTLPTDITLDPYARRRAVALLVAAMLLGGVASWFASSRPDGLEWSIAKSSGRPDTAGLNTPVHQTLAGVQEKTALLPEYGWAEKAQPEANTAAWPHVDAGTSIAGLSGGVMTLALVVLLGGALRGWSRMRRT